MHAASISNLFSVAFSNINNQYGFQWSIGRLLWLRGRTLDWELRQLWTWRSVVPPLFWLAGRGLHYLTNLISLKILFLGLQELWKDTTYHKADQVCQSTKVSCRELSIENSCQQLFLKSTWLSFAQERIFKILVDYLLLKRGEREQWRPLYASWSRQSTVSQRICWRGLQFIFENKWFFFWNTLVYSIFQLRCAMLHESHYWLMIRLLVQTSFCGEVGFGIWLKHHGKISKLTEKFQNSRGAAEWVLKFFSEFWNFSVVFESQIPNPTSPQKDVCD